MIPNDPPVWMCYEGIASAEDLEDRLNTPAGPRALYEDSDVEFLPFPSEAEALEHAAASPRPCYITEFLQPEEWANK